MGNEFDSQFVRLPFLKNKIPVIVDIQDHPAIEGIENWPKEMKDQLAAACFRSYQDKVKMIGLEALSRIRRPSEVWKHLSIRSIQISPVIPDCLLIYVVPAWDESEHMEWCIQKGKVVYVGQFLGYPPDGYADITFGNFA